MKKHTHSTEPVSEPARPYRRETRPLEIPKPLTDVDRYHQFVGSGREGKHGMGETNERDPIVWLYKTGQYVSEAGAQALWVKFRESSGGLPGNVEDFTFRDFAAFQKLPTESLSEQDKKVIAAYEKYLAGPDASIAQTPAVEHRQEVKDAMFGHLAILDSKAAAVRVMNEKPQE